jgi:DNA invertase Pin-like site-specific DNA recombinase
MVKKRGGRVVSVAGEGTDSDDATSVLMRRIVDAFAEHERLVIAARTRAALQAKRRRGERTGRVPLGFTLASPDVSVTKSRAGLPTQLVAVPEQMAVVVRIRQERAAGKSMRKIAAGLTADGIPTATGGSVWSHATIQRMVMRFRELSDATAEVLVGVSEKAVWGERTEDVAYGR